MIDGIINFLHALFPVYYRKPVLVFDVTISKEDKESEAFNELEKHYFVIDGCEGVFVKLLTTKDEKEIKRIMEDNEVLEDFEDYKT